jgi:tRNA uridine 5-carboxymethylaminomethyl modification enzyme
MDFDLIVVGGGHAGIEAANIAAKKRLSVLLITNHLDLIGQMSCNPAIGGIAKGNIAREVDALGGLMGKLIDRAGIHFRMLNTSKGAAVWGNRAQADKILYRTLSRNALEKQETLFLLQGMAKRVLVEGESVCGVEMDSGEKIKSKCVILAMGTFLNGVVHIGLNSFPAGRAGEPPSLSIAESINDLGIKCGRLKTGTSPRIDARTINFNKLICQPGDEKPWPFSFSTNEPLQNKAVCWIGRSNEATHKIIKDNLDRSPLYTGKIKSIGPRYCPSIEDKVIRFGERDGHTLFLEPESIQNQEMYLNGLSTSLPFDVQIKMVQSVDGLEKAKIVRPGYGIEYTFFQPIQLHSTLESKIVKNLYFTGQINGTSGYEEAACQGVVAGINATQRILGEEELVLSRESSYCGVLIDDLVTRGTEEPYRMFTSRAEHRLKLRQDNCDERLMPIAFHLGFLEKELYDQRQRVWEKREETIAILKSVKVGPVEWEQTGEILEHPVKAYELLKRPTVSLDLLEKQCNLVLPQDRAFRLALEAEVKYSGFIAKEEAEIDKVRRLEEARIPDGFDYDTVKGLLTESRMKLKKIQPATIGQATRIPGVTPADISIIALHVARVYLSARRGPINKNPLLEELPGPKAEDREK